MAPINTKNVHRTNFLLDFPYGEDFRYDEMVVTSAGDLGKHAAEMLAKANPFGGKDAPKPGEGPTREQRENGYYDIVFIGETENGETASLCVKGDRDPGYGSTSRMIAEAALCLAQDKIKKDGGVWTPGALMGKKLVKRLEARAGLSFVGKLVEFFGFTFVKIALVIVVCFLHDGVHPKALRIDQRFKRCNLFSNRFHIQFPFVGL
jgi:short subunit dehydrogenase-like uncharacterized protein